MARTETVLPLISVIIPIYNAEKYLRESLRSLCVQTYTNLEIILVDDGSTDNSSKICLDFLKEDNRFKVINKSNGGVSSARNEGLKAVRGEYVYFMDADDIAHPMLIRTLYKLLDDSNTDCSIVSFSTSDLYSPNWNCSVSRFNGFEAIKELHWGKRYQGQLWTKLFKKKLIDGLFFDERLSINEDMEFVQSYFLKCESIIYKGVDLYFYRQYETSSYHRQYTSRDLSAVEACVLMKQEGLKFYPQLQNYFNKSLIVAYMFVLTKLTNCKSAERRKLVGAIRKGLKKVCNGESIKLYSSSKSKWLKLFLVRKSWMLFVWYCFSEKKAYDLYHRFIMKKTI